MIKFEVLGRRVMAGGAACLIGGLVMGVAAPAMADTTVGGRQLGQLVNIAYSGTLNWWAGGYQTSNGLGFCLQPTLNASTGLSLSDPLPLTSFVNDQGVALTTAQLNQLAYFMWVAAQNPSPSNGDAVAYKFVVTTLLGYNAVPLFMGSGKLSVPHNLSLDYPDSDAVKITSRYGVLDLARALLAQARAEANNWDGNGTLTVGDAASPGQEIVASVQLTGLNNGFPVNFKITRPDGATDTVAATTVNGVATISYTPTGFGHYQVTAQLAKAAAPRFPMAAVSSRGTQSLLLLTGQARNWSGQAAFDLVRPTPTVATQASSQLALPGETLHDTVTLGNLVDFADTTYEVSGGLYQVAPLDDWTCPGPDAPEWVDATMLVEVPPTPVPDDARDAEGNAVMQVGEWQVPRDAEAVCVSYGESVAMLVDGEVVATADHPAGTPEQTALVLPSPAISTRISAPTLKQGDTVNDTVTVTGLSPADLAGYAFTGRLIAVGVNADGTCPGVGDPAWAGGSVLATFAQDVTPVQVPDDAVSATPDDPSTEPSAEPSAEPSVEPSVEPSTEPSTEPTTTPSVTPTGDASSEPSSTPTDATTPTSLGGQATWQGVGTWTLASRPDTLCVTYAETLTMTVPGHEPLVVDHTAGEKTQTALVPGVIAEAGGWHRSAPPLIAALLLAGFGGVAAGAWTVRRLV